MTHIPTKQSYGIGEFVISIDDRVGICEDKTSVFLNPLSQLLTLLTIVCNCFSVVFLLLLLLTYIAFRTLRTVPGLILMNVVVSLICTQIIFTISNLLERGTPDCIFFRNSTPLLLACSFVQSVNVLSTYVSSICVL